MAVRGLSTRSRTFEGGVMSKPRPLLALRALISREISEYPYKGSITQEEIMRWSYATRPNAADGENGYRRGNGFAA